MNNPKVLKLLLVDDQILFVESLRIVITEHALDMEVVDIANNGKEAIEKAKEYLPDIILMDVRMEGIDGVQATHIIHDILPEIKIIMLTTFNDDDYVKEALRYGAVGYLLKDMKPKDLIDSIHLVISGITQISSNLARHLIENKEHDMDVSYGLTRREKEILELLIQLVEIKEIAKKLNITEQTVKNYSHAIYEKYNVTSRLQLIKALNA